MPLLLVRRCTHACRQGLGQVQMQGKRWKPSDTFLRFIKLGAGHVRTTADEQLLANDPGGAQGNEDQQHVEKTNEVLGRQLAVRHVLL